MDAPPRVLRGHTGTVFSAVFSPDGTRLATGGRDGTARIWSLAEPGAAPVVLPGHEVWAYGLAFSPDGRWLATASKHGVIRLWSVQGGPARILGDHIGKAIRRVHSLTFSPDGRFVISADKGGKVRRWSIDDGSMRSLPRHLASANVTLTARGQVVTYGAGTIRLFSSQGARMLRRWSISEGVRGVATSPDGRWVAVGTQVGDVWLLDLDANEPTRRRLGRIDGAPEMLAFDADGARLIAGTWTGHLGVWHVSSGAFEALGGHNSAVRFVGFDAHGDALSGGGPLGAVRRWPLDMSDEGLRAQLKRRSQMCLPPQAAERWLTPDEQARADICP
jgi:WD40 repeat protein